jgi:hypothetical protein
MSFERFRNQYNKKIHLGGSFFIFNQVFAFIALLVLSYLIYLSYGENAGGIQCLYKSKLGKECPTCGFTRSFVDYISFQFESGIRRNNASFYYFLFSCYFALSRFGWSVFSLFFQKKKLHSEYIKWDITVLVFLFIWVNFYIFLF